MLDCYQLCRILYKGLKNFYNKTNGMCSTVKICLFNEKYDYMTNSCNPIAFDSNSFPNNTYYSPIQKTENINSLNSNFSCINGKEIPENKLCICYPGWYDENSLSSPNIIYKCNKLIPGFSNSSSSISNNNINSFNTSGNQVLFNNETMTINSIPVCLFKTRHRLFFQIQII